MANDRVSFHAGDNLSVELDRTESWSLFIELKKDWCRINRQQAEELHEWIGNLLKVEGDD